MSRLPLLILCGFLAFCAATPHNRHTNTQQQRVAQDRPRITVPTRPRLPNTLLDAVPNSVGILLTTPEDDGTLHVWLPLGKRVHTRDAPELPLHPVSARITAMIRSTPKKATTEHLDRVVCTVYPTSNRTKAIDGDQEQEWAMQFSRPDDLIRFVEPGTEFWLGGNEVEAYECV